MSLHVTLEFENLERSGFGFEDEQQYNTNQYSFTEENKS